MKIWKRLASGLFVLVMLASFAGAAFAAAGKPEIRTSGVVVMDQVRVKPGEEYTVDGKKIPAVVTYTDPSGQTHNYVPVDMISDYLDIPTSWSEKRNSVVLGPTSEGAEYHITTSDDPDNPIRNSIVKAPVFGKKVGPLTEIDPKTVDTSGGPLLILEDETKVDTYVGFDSTVRANAMHGKHLVLTITNNGTNPLISRAGRTYTLNGYEGLSSVKIEPGQTLVRAFEIDDEVDRIRNNFVSSIMQYYNTERFNVTVSLKQYK